MRSSALVLLAAAAALASAAPVERLFYPAHDNTIDHSSLRRLEPEYTPRLLYSDRPRSHPVMATTYTMNNPAIIAENVAAIENHSCDHEQTEMTLTFSRAVTLGIAASWPQSLVVVTNDVSCNSDGERGVYLSESMELDTESLTLRLSVQRTAWMAVAESMTVSFLNLGIGGEDALPTIGLGGGEDAEKVELRLRV